MLNEWEGTAWEGVTLSGSELKRLSLPDESLPDFVNRLTARANAPVYRLPSVKQSLGALSASA
jgi:hypothetical protein